MKLTLNPSPTFKAKVDIPVPGSADVSVEFVFKYRDREESAKFREEFANADDVDLIMAVCTGWELDDEFSKENVEKLCRCYPLVGVRLIAAYFAELMGVRGKN
jgi:hypothetical protein